MTKISIHTNIYIDVYIVYKDLKIGFVEIRGLEMLLHHM